MLAPGKISKRPLRPPWISLRQLMLSVGFLIVATHLLAQQKWLNLYEQREFLLQKILVGVWEYSPYPPGLYLVRC